MYVDSLNLIFFHISSHFYLVWLATKSDGPSIKFCNRRQTSFRKRRWTGGKVVSYVNKARPRGQRSGPSEKEREKRKVTWRLRKLTSSALRRPDLRLTSLSFSLPHNNPTFFHTLSSRKIWELDPVSSCQIARFNLVMLSGDEFFEIHAQELGGGGQEARRCAGHLCCRSLLPHVTWASLLSFFQFSRNFVAEATCLRLFTRFLIIKHRL